MQAKLRLGKVISAWELMEVFTSDSGWVWLGYGLQRDTEVEGSACVKGVKPFQLPLRQI